MSDKAKKGHGENIDIEQKEFNDSLWDAIWALESAYDSGDDGKKRTYISNDINFSIKHLKEIAEKIAEDFKNARVDLITGFYSRAAGDELLEKRLEESLRTGGTGSEEIKKNRREERQGPGKASLIYIDVNNLGKINNTFKHSVGDDLIRIVAECIRKTFREKDLFCRCGGDEFFVFADDLCKETAEARMLKAQQLIQKQLHLYKEENGHAIDSAASYGIAEIDKKEWTPLDARNLIGTIKDEADAKMYLNKLAFKEARARGATHDEASNQAMARASHMYMIYAEAISNGAKHDDALAMQSANSGVPNTDGKSKARSFSHRNNSFMIIAAKDKLN